MDVTDAASIEAGVAEAEAQAGAIDILVNNSGVSTTQRLVDVTPEDFDFVFDTNTRGAFFVAQAVGRRMIARAKDEPGRQARIVNIASMAGLKVLAQIGVYCMSKAAVVQMTKAMALEWGRFDINVNAICPGYIVTELNEAHWDTEGGRKLVQMLPRKRLGRPEDLDGLVLLLASEQSGFVNGAVIAADDGFAL
jgi:NAD(P)-dependent dehydrogenase (short-subunit alcohol dehydrogenase family)